MPRACHTARIGPRASGLAAPTVRRRSHQMAYRHPPWRCTGPPSGNRSRTPSPTLPAITNGDVHPHVGRVRRARRQGRRGARRGRARPRLEDRAVPLQRQRVPRSPVRRVQDPRRPDQRELPLPRRGAVVPARQRRRRGAVLPHLARPTVSRGCVDRLPQLKLLVAGRRRRPPIGDRRRRRTRRLIAAHAPMPRITRGDDPTSTCSTPAARPACPRA